MYLKHFKLKRHPFQMKPDDDFLYMSSQHSRALVFMDYAAWNPEGFVIISGEIGSGKTTLVKRLLRNYQGKVNNFHIAYTNLESAELFYYMTKQAGIQITDQNKVTMLYALNDFLKEKTKNGTPFVLVIDEAQNLTQANLEDIRLLAGLEGLNGPMLKVVLLGQPELQLNVNRVPQLRQRVKLHYHLNGLGEEETKGYIEYRLKIAGLTRNLLFDEAMIKVIFQYSRGIPRLINKICDALLMCAFADERKKPMISDLDDVLDELMLDEPASDPEPEETAPVEETNNAVTQPIAAMPATIDMEQINGYLERIAKALEGIENKIDVLAKERHY
ncbi:ExeA family protein [Gynuella sp.]|uniref:ExeA family protein n=1 Tax=Gynuella sp. TaxID=2969146 RepID=UPI003D0C9BF2